MKKVLLLVSVIGILNVLSAQTVTINSVPTEHCTNTWLDVPYTVSGTFNAGNTFVLQLSDASGNFGSPLNLQTITGTTSGMFTASVPSAVPPGTGYKVRIVSSNPVTTSVSSASFEVDQYIHSGTLTGTTYRCQCRSYNIYAATGFTNATNFSYSISPTAAGTVSTHQGTNALVEWNNSYNGTATLTLTASNLTCTHTTSISITNDNRNSLGVDMGLFTFVGTQYFNGKWSNYYRSNDQRTWQLAKTTCENSCGTLACFSSVAEGIWVANNIYSGLVRWIGGTDQLQEGSMHWINGESWVYANWLNGAFNNSTTRDFACIASNPYTYPYQPVTISGATTEWVMEEGTGSHYYILERDNNQTTTALTPNGGQLCAGSSYTLNFTKTGAFDAGNVFYVELSDANGDFAISQYIGSVTSTTANTINFTVPPGTPASANYRIRVASSRPLSSVKYETGPIGISYTSPPSVSLSASPGTSVCSGFVTTFTATPTNGGYSSNYNFLVNGVSQQNTTSNTFSTTSLTNGQTVNCVMVRNDACATPSNALSNTLTMAVNTDVRVPAVSIAITSGSQTICAGSTVTFTATPTNGGTSPVYNFKVNGVSVQSGSLNTYTTSTLTNSQTVTCDMTSSYFCPLPATVTSNSIVMTVSAVVNPRVTISSNVPVGELCTNTTATFTANPTNGGSTPTYQWKKNGTNVATGNTYTTSTWANGDVVSCVMTSNATCALPSVAWSTNTVIAIENNTANSWQQKAKMDFNQGVGPSKRTAAVGFSIGNKGYLGTGQYLGTRYKDFWEYDPATNTWTQRADFGGTARFAAVGFSIGNKGYIGTGSDGTNKQDLWEYDPATNAWTAKANFPGAARRYATAFTVGNKAYVGTGLATSNTQDFYAYNPASNTWVAKANFPGGVRQSAASFTVGDRGYVGTGINGAAEYSDLFEYNPATNTWAAKASLPGGARTYAVGFGIGSYGYLGLGVTVSTGLTDFWQYNPTTNTWSARAAFSGSVRAYTVSFVIGTNGYVATGDDGTNNNDTWEYNSGTDTWVLDVNYAQTMRTYAAAFSIGANGYVTTGNGNVMNNDLWQYNLTTNTWTQRANMPGPARNAAVAFSIGSRGYVGTGQNGTTRYKDFYEYNANSNSWTQKADFGGTARYGAVGFSIGSKGYIGTGYDGANKQDFWEYNPATDTWVAKANFSGTARRYAVGFSVNNKGYIGTGVDAASKADFYEYDPSTNTWASKANYAGGACREATAFTIANKGYVGTGYNGSYLQSFYEYDPSANTWTARASFGGTARYAAAGFSIGNRGFIATGVDASTGLSDLWEYTPANTTKIKSGQVLGPLCTGDAVSVPYTTGCVAFNAGNVFTAQLSDPLGSFGNPVTIGNLAGTGSGTISATIPLNTVVGTKYHIRVVSSDPITIGTENQLDITINPTVTPSVSIAQTTGPNPLCAGSTATFTAYPTNGGNSPYFDWYKNGVLQPPHSSNYSTNTLADGDVIYAVLTSNAVCTTQPTATSNSITMNVYATPTWYLDTDNDNYYTGSGITQCTSPGVGYKSTGLLGGNDCAPSDPTKWQSAQLYHDHDFDTYGDIGGSLVTVCFGNTIPSGYSINNTDCAPNDNTKWQSTILYIDADNDNYDNGTATVCYGASIPSGYKATTLGSDCNDANAALTTNCGAVNTWLGNTTQWSVNSNWSSGTAPTTCSDDAVIPSLPTGGQFPTLTAIATVGDVTIEQGATVTINGAGGLQVCGDLSGTGTGGTVTGTSTNGVILTGSGPQSINGNLNLNILQVNNTGSGVNNTGNVNITTALIMQDGNFTNSGALTLKSDINGTAYLDNFTSGTAGTYNGLLSVERYIGNTADGYRDISSPVATTVADLADDFPVFGQNGVQCWYAYNPYPNVQYYDEALSIVSGAYYEGWMSYTGLSNPLTAMKGIAVRTYKGAPFTLNFTGTPYTGPQSINITQTTSGTPSQDGWNMIGNPYPSPISWNEVKTLNPGITSGSQYSFKTTGEYAGSWGAHNGTTGTNGATNEVAIGQAFMVLANGNNTVSMNNSVRIASATAAYYKNNSLQDELRLTLSNNTNSDEIVAYTDANATAGYDPEQDAVKIPAGSTVYMSFNIQQTEYAIHVTDSITEQTELPLILWARDTGNYNFTVTEQNLPNLTPYLKDATANTETNLAINSPLLNLNGQEIYNNYSIVFKTNVSTGIHETEPLVRIYSSGNEVYIYRADNSKATITISNILGQQIIETSTKSELTALKLNGTEAWYAIVKVKEGDKVTVAKVFISNK